MADPNITTDGTATAPQATPEEHQAALGKLYPTMNEKRAEPSPSSVAEVRELRESESTLRKLYNVEHTFGRKGEALDQLTLALHPEASQHQIDAVRIELAHAFTDLGASKDDVLMLASRAASKVSPEQDEANRLDAVKAVRQLYGREYDRVVALTQRMVTRDPRIAGLLNKTRAGNDPKIVLRLVELAVTNHKRGRLK